MSPRRYLAALLLGLAGIAVADLLIRNTELVTGRYIASGVPPILAFAVVMALLGARPLLRRLHPGLAPDRQQLLVVYAMMTVAVVVAGQYVIRAFLPHLLTLQYWGARQAALKKFAPFIPSWFAPTDPEAIRLYFEGTHGGPVPWGEWLAPLGLWLLFFVAVFTAAFSLVHLFRRQWLQNERLGFPLLNLPLSITAGAEEGSGEGGLGPLFRQPLMWVGFGCAALFNGINILHAVYPWVPAPGFFYAFTDQFPDPPWTPLNTIMLFFMLEAVGFGYFLSLEVSFSAWAFYLLEKAVAVAGLANGVEQPGFPFIQDQSAGAYLGVGLLLLWGARRALVAPFQTGAGVEYRSERRAYLGLAASVGFLLFWCWRAGMALSVAAPYFGILLCFVLVYARLRAETGVPFEFIYPYGLPKEMLVNALSTRGILDVGGPRTLVLLSSLAWLSRHHYAESMGAYQVDSLKLSEVAKIPRGWMVAALLLAVVAGLAGSAWLHLDAFYDQGSNLAAAGTGRGEYRAQVALQEFQLMATRAATPPPRDMARVWATGAGFAAALGLGMLRTRVVRSPFHPLGFILATAYGDHTTIFFPMLVAWAIKATVLRLGGLRLYRAGIPFFLGLIIGHFLIGGLLWPLFSLLIGPDAAKGYHVHFGG